MERGNIILYDDKPNIEIRLDNDTIWLNQRQMADLFDKDSDTIGLHLKNIFATKELDKKATTEKYSVVQKEGKRRVRRNVLFYNLDAIISVGYRVNSKRGTQFRIWANSILKDYLVKGYAVNEKRLAQKEEEIQILKNGISILGRALEEKLFFQVWRNIKNLSDKWLQHLILTYLEKRKMKIFKAPLLKLPKVLKQKIFTPLLKKKPPRSYI